MWGLKSKDFVLFIFCTRLLRDGFSFQRYSVILLEYTNYILNNLRKRLWTFKNKSKFVWLNFIPNAWWLRVRIGIIKEPFKQRNLLLFHLFQMIYATLLQITLSLLLLFYRATPQMEKKSLKNSNIIFLTDGDFAIKIDLGFFPGIFTKVPTKKLFESLDGC